MGRVIHNVPLIPQCGTMTCWYAAALMVVRWANRRSGGRGAIGADLDTEAVRQEVCGRNVFINIANPGAVATVARLTNLSAETAQLTPQVLENRLDLFGPIWFGGRVRGYRRVSQGCHVIVIRGIDGNTVYINDPSPPGVGLQFTMNHGELFSQLQADPGIPFLHA